MNAIQDLSNERTRELCDRITGYLSMGGLFNPELADHDTVRDLLRECRKVLNDSLRN